MNTATAIPAAPTSDLHAALAPTAQFSDGALAKTFLLAGRARFTLVSKKTGARFTFQITKADGEGASKPYFVALLRGPSNESDYAFLGTIFMTNRVQTGGSEFGSVYGNVPAPAPKFVHGKKSKIGAEAPSAKAFAWAWAHLAKGEIPESLELWHEGRCGKCGRALTVPSSIASGIGPVCEESGF